MTCRGNDVLDTTNRREISEIHSTMECSNMIRHSPPVRVCYDDKLSNGYQRSISLGKYKYIIIDILYYPFISSTQLSFYFSLYVCNYLFK